MALGHRVGILPNASRGSREAGGEAEAPGHTSVVLGSESKIPEGLWRNGVGAGDTFQTGLHRPSEQLLQPWIHLTKPDPPGHSAALKPSVAP